MKTLQILTLCFQYLWPWLVFFVIQGLHPEWEKLLALLVILITLYTFWLGHERGEIVLFFIGLAIGLLVEVGLGLVFRTQFWNHASLYGVPYWLPLVWGYGFVVMRRLGNVIVAAV